MNKWHDLGIYNKTCHQQLVYGLLLLQKGEVKMMKQALRKEFGQLLKELRKAARMSQEELAEHLDVSRTTIAKTESGHNLPKARFVERSCRLFDSTDLVAKYILIQEDKKELTALATVLANENFSIAKRIMKRVIQESMRTHDLQTIFSALFQIVMWDLKIKGKVNPRKIGWLIKVTEKLDPDPAAFINLTDKLYHISRLTNNYKAFIQITEAITDKVHLGNKRLSYLLGHQANAYYYSGQPHKAYKKTSKAIEIMDNEIYKHTTFIYHKHSMICLQTFNYDEALEYEQKCLNLLKPSDRFYWSVKAGMARIYYMMGKYDEAKPYWKEVLKRLGENDLERTHSLNDIIMMEIQLGNLTHARAKIKECERLLAIAKRTDWRFFGQEDMLLRRNKVLLRAVETEDFITPEVADILHELENSHLKDEHVLTKNFVLERTFLSCKLKSSER
jgi:transcriptional regulator with XRE-family HTH domain